MPTEPNYRNEIGLLAAQYPREWAEAHRPELGTDRATAFIKIVAKALNRTDPRVGLNGKRGTDELSMDALCIDYGLPVDGRRFWVVDVIAGAGGSSPSPAWQWDTSGAANKWIDPTGGETPLPEPLPPPQPTPNTELAQIQSTINRLEAELTAFRSRIVGDLAQYRAMTQQTIEDKTVGIYNEMNRLAQEIVSQVKENTKVAIATTKVDAKVKWPWQ